MAHSGSDRGPNEGSSAIARRAGSEQTAEPRHPRLNPHAARLRGETGVRLSAIAALGAAVLTAAAFQADRAAAPATAWLGLVATAVAASLLVALRRSLLPVAFAMVLAFLTVVYLPRLGATAIAALVVVLASMLVVTAAELGRGGADRGALPWLGVALAAQVIVRADKLWLEPFSATTIVSMVALPAVAALALAGISRRGGAGLAVAAGGAALAAGPGFALAPVAALALAAGLASWRPSWSRIAPLFAALAAFGHEPAWAATALVGIAAAAGSLSVPDLAHHHTPTRAPARAARAALAGVALGALLAAAMPWQRAEPVAAILRAVSTVRFRGIEEPLPQGSYALSLATPSVVWRLSGAPVRAIVIDSFLSEGADLECGKAVARIRLAAPGGTTIERSLVVGPGTGEWASARPDVAARLGCDELEPYSHWLPSDGRYFGRTFRARFQLDPPVAAESVEIERLLELPAEVRLHLQRVTAER